MPGCTIRMSLIPRTLCIRDSRDMGGGGGRDGGLVGAAPGARAVAEAEGAAPARRVLLKLCRLFGHHI